MEYVNKMISIMKTF